MGRLRDLTPRAALPARLSCFRDLGSPAGISGSIQDVMLITSSLLLGSLSCVRLESGFSSR